MKKVLVLLILLLTGCGSQRFYLSNKYYNEGKFVTNYDVDESYIVYTYNNYCILEKPCDEVFQEFMNKYNIDIVSIPFEEFKLTKFYQTVKYAPSIVIIKDGSIVDYLDANKDNDLQKYQNEKKFEEWITKYIYTSK